MRHNDQNRIRNLVDAARNGTPLPTMPDPQQHPPLNMQILHAGMAVANMGIMEGVESLEKQVAAWETAMGLVPPNPADAEVVAIGRVLARAQAELRAILKRPAPVVTAETEALPMPPDEDRPPEGLRLVE